MSTAHEVRVYLPELGDVALVLYEIRGGKVYVQICLGMHHLKRGPDGVSMVGPELSDSDTQVAVMSARQDWQKRQPGGLAKA